MEKIVVVSRTRMRNGVCCGAINISTGEFVRMHNANGGNLPSNAPYQIGEVYDASYCRAWNARPKPHVEDKEIRSARKIGEMSTDELVDFIDRRVHVYSGRIDTIFEGSLDHSAYSPFVGPNNVPNESVCFWRTDAPIQKYVFMGKIKYRYKSNNISYVGFQDPIDVIPAGTLLRMSLANWWAKDQYTEKRCYLQLSGWYGL